MSSIIQCTTPIIAYTFNVTDVSDISAAYLTIEQQHEVVLEKTLAEATVDTENNLIYWRLTQEETLQLSNSIYIMLNWKTVGGVRGASKKDIVFISDNLKDEVI